jgi:putative FmdB family regulatory protein
MPLYTYQCDRHGEFSAWGRMSQSNDPQPCPACEVLAPRALAHPAVGSRSAAGGESAAMGCGEGACATDGPSFGGHCCGAGCVH